MEEPLYDISQVSPRIILDIKYATADNFLGKSVYSVAKAYLRRSVALKLHEVQGELERMGLGLKVWDAYRPLPVQHILWSHVPDERYVADPQKGSCHNRGAAVDLTLVDAQGRELPMPTHFDDFTEKAHLDCEDLPQEILSNRELLISVMVRGGFTPMPTEWWHFNDNHAEQYSILSTSFEQLALQGPA